MEKADPIKQRGERDLSDEESWTPEQEEYRRHLMKQKLKQDALLKKEKLERGRSRPRERSRDPDARSSWQDRVKERAKSEPKVKDRSKSEPKAESLGPLGIKERREASRSRSEQGRARM